MNTPATILRDLSVADRSLMIETAAQTLRDGGLVVMPTETVYGLAVNGASKEGVGRLAELAHDADAPGGPWAWHAPTAASVREVLGLENPVHIRLLNRLAPGPVTFLFELTDNQLTLVRGKLGVEHGVIDGGGELAVRVPHNEVASRLLSLVGVPVIADSIGSLGLHPASDLGAAVAQSQPGWLGQATLLDDGPTTYAQRSGRIRLCSGGGYEVLSPGPLDERKIHAVLKRTILFVCTGNTCRSPMGEAIARDLLNQTPASGLEMKVLSAGTAASSGMGATPEAIAALRQLGVDPGTHSTRPLTRSLIAEADAIYTMTESHRAAVLSIDPSCADRVYLLDPDGAPVADPIGMTPDVYVQTAESMREMIRRRLEELEQ